MGMSSWMHWVPVIILVAVLFGGRGKISSLMGDAAKGIRAFKDGLKGDDDKNHDHREPLPRTERERDEVRVDR